MEGELIILGCGGSAGVPTIGNRWGVCDPNEPRNARLRPSVAIKSQNTLVIVDTGPDFRQQMNNAALGVPDAIITTHIHSDHINGLDELRTLQRIHKRRFPLYANAETMRGLHQRLDYMFKETEGGFYPAVLDAVTVEAGDDITIGDLTFQTYNQIHGSLNCLGIRIGNVGYSTDVKYLEKPAIEKLKGITTWIVDAAGNRSRENPVHACIDEIIEMNAEIGAEKVYLTHMPATMDYRTLLKELPEGYEPAYDGQVIHFQI